MPQYPKTLNVGPWKGLNNRDEEFKTSLEYLKTAENIDIDNTGGIVRRKGYTLLFSGSYHSAKYFNGFVYVVQDGNFVRLNKKLIKDLVIFSGVGNNKIYYEEVEGDLYFTSEVRSGIIKSDNTIIPFGVEIPRRTPDVSTTVGTLSPGTYTLTLTYSNSYGIEGGALLYESITLSTNGAIVLSNIPQPVDSNITEINIYLSDPDGSELYYHSSVPNGTTTTTLSSPPLSYGFDKYALFEAPKGTSLNYYKGSLYIASGNILYYSEPNYYTAWKLDSNYLPFDKRILQVMPVDNGIWVALEDKLVYLSGSNPTEFSLNIKDRIKPIEGSGALIRGKDIVIDNTPLGDKWLLASNRGIFILFNDGVSFSVTDEYKFPEAASGNSSILASDGLVRYLLNTNSAANNLKFQESFNAQVIKAQ